MRRFCPICLLMAVTVLYFSAMVTRNAAALDETASSPRLLDVEVVIQSQTSHRLKAQEWGRVLQGLGYTVKFREARPGDVTGVEDLEEGGLLQTRIVAGMVQDGAIQIGKQRFTADNPEPLLRFFEEVKTYGAGGPPNANPSWGLSPDQFREVTQLLAQPVTESIELRSSVLAIEAIGLPGNMRMLFTDASRSLALGRQPASLPESLELQGFSKGTAIAIVLAQYGLGFRPKPVGPGRYDLEIDRGDETSNLWPVGWKPEQSYSEILPAYLKAIPLDVEDVEVDKLIGAVAEKLQLPFYTSNFVLHASKLNLSELKYTRKNVRISPFRLLTAVGDKLELGFDVRVDEAGKMFLWVTTAGDAAAFRHRFAHVKTNTD